VLPIICADDGTPPFASPRTAVVRKPLQLPNEGNISHRRHPWEQRQSWREAARVTDQREGREAQNHTARFWTNLANEDTSCTGCCFD